MTFLVSDQGRAVASFVDALGFDVVADEPCVVGDATAKRWLVVRRPDGGAGLLLARAASQEQHAAVGSQFGGRVGLFLEVADFTAAHRRMIDAGLRSLEQPRSERDGTDAVFEDVAGNHWDLLGPSAAG